MTKKRGLGSKRGLDALISSIKQEKPLVTPTAPLQTPSLQADKADSTAQTQTTVHKVISMAVEHLQAGKYQPRTDIKESSLQELADSISEHGVMQPIVIRALGADDPKTGDSVTHEIIAGERRWRASKLAGLTHIPAIERVLSDEVAIALALIENIQREDLSVLEQAAALARFHSEFGLSHAMIAKLVGKARATITNLLRLNQLHDDVKQLMTDGKLDMGHARTLLALSPEQQPVIAHKIVQANMTVRDAEKLIKSILNPESPKAPDPDKGVNAPLSQKLSDRLGASVKVKQHKDGKGSMEILFYSVDELNELLNQLGVTD